MFTAYRSLLNNPTKNVRDSLVNHCAQILACYRKNCASPSSAGQVNTAVVLIAAKTVFLVNCKKSVALCTARILVNWWLCV